MGLIGSSIQTGVGFFYLCVSPFVEQAQDNHYKANNGDLINGIARDWRYEMDLYYIIFGICAAIGSLYVTVYACLVHGVRKRRHGFILPWLVVHMIAIVVSFVLTIASLVIAVINIDRLAFGYFTLHMLVIAIMYYFWVVVRSEYFVIKEANNGIVNLSKEEKRTRLDFHA